MDHGTQPLPRLRPKWQACGECARCCSGTGHTPASPDRDCWAEHLNAAVDIAIARAEAAAKGRA